METHLEEHKWLLKGKIGEEAIQKRKLKKNLSGGREEKLFEVAI